MSERLPEVSVVMPIYNEREYIEESLQSVIEQDYEGEMEILVIDGGSTDGTVDVVRKYQEIDKRIKLYHNPRKNVSAGLNVGLRKASGEIFIRVDGHNCVPAEYVRILVFELVSGRSDCVGTYRKPIGNNLIGRLIAEVYKSFLGVGGVFKHYKQRVYVDTISFGAYYLSDLREVGYFREDFLCAEDDEYNFRFVRSGRKILLIPDTYTIYYVREKLTALIKQMFCYGYNKPRTLILYPEFVSIRYILPSISVLFIMGFLGSAFHSSLSGMIFTGIPLATYLSLISGYTIKLIFKKDIRYLLFPLISGIIHLSYGVGECLGIVRALLMWVRGDLH